MSVSSGSEFLGTHLSPESWEEPIGNLSRGVALTLQALVEKWKGSGSSFSADYLMAPERMGHKSPLLMAMQQLRHKIVPTEANRHIKKEKLATVQGVAPTLDNLYKTGAFDTQSLSQEGFAFLKIWQGLLPNIDDHGYDRTHDIQTGSRRVMDILALGCKYLSPDEVYILSKKKYFDRLISINVYKAGDTWSDGTNIMDLAETHKERFTKMLNFRIAQTGTLEWSIGGRWVEIDRAGLDRDIEMVGQPESMGEWLMHTARAIRAMAMHGIPASRINIQGFLDKLPSNDKNYRFEEVVGVATNLLVAAEHDRELTEELIVKLGLSQYLAKAQVDEVREGMQKAEAEYWGSNVVGEKIWPGNYGLFSDLAAKLSQYMIVSADEFCELANPPGEREEVEAIVVSSKVGEVGLKRILAGGLRAVRAAIRMYETKEHTGEILTEEYRLLAGVEEWIRQKVVELHN